MTPRCICEWAGFDASERSRTDCPVHGAHKPAAYHDDSAGQPRKQEPRKCKAKRSHTSGNTKALENRETR
jgi:hypothetical protein